MASRLTPFGFFCKWILAPAVLFAAGYFVLGPKLGKTPIPKFLDKSLQPSHASGAAQPAGPDVAVDAKPASGSK